MENNLYYVRYFPYFKQMKDGKFKKLNCKIIQYIKKVGYERGKCTMCYRSA